MFPRWIVVRSLTVTFVIGVWSAPKLFEGSCRKNPREEVCNRSFKFTKDVPCGRTPSMINASVSCNYKKGIYWTNYEFDNQMNGIHGIGLPSNLTATEYIVKCSLRGVYKDCSALSLQWSIKKEVSPSPHHSCGTYFLSISDTSTTNVNSSGRDLKLTICNSPCYATEDLCHQCDFFYYYYHIDDSLKTIEGFLLNITFLRYGVRKFGHRSFLINANRAGTGNEDIIFEYDCWQVFVAGSYDIMLHTIFKNSVQSTISNPISTNFTASCYFEKPDVRLDWNPVIDYKISDDSNALTVFFTPATPGYGYKSYIVQVVTEDPEWALKNIRYNKTVDHKCPMEGVIFTNVMCPDKYTIKVRTPDEAPFVKGSIDFTGNACKKLTTSTEATKSSTDDTAPHLLSVVIEPLKLSQDPDGGYFNVKLAYSVIGSLLGLAAIICLLLLLKNKRCKRTMQSLTNEDSGNDSGEYTEIRPVHIILIYSSDNQLHRNVVNQFAKFLHNQCRCDVEFDAWYKEDVHRLSPLEWMLRKIRAVDNVVIVHSEGSFKQHEAYINEMPVEKVVHDTPLDDMFIPAIKEFQNEFYLQDNQKRKKFFHVYFPYSQKSNIVDLKIGKKYLLMNHIEDLFLSLHDLSKFSCDGTMHAKQIQYNSYSESEEGKNLEKAIKEASDYFSTNKDWFNQTYKRKNDQLPNKRIPDMVIVDERNSDKFSKLSVVENTEEMDANENVPEWIPLNGKIPNKELSEVCVLDETVENGIIPDVAYKENYYFELIQDIAACNSEESIHVGYDSGLGSKDSNFDQLSPNVRDFLGPDQLNSSRFDQKMVSSQTNAWSDQDSHTSAFQMEMDFIPPSQSDSSSLNSDNLNDQLKMFNVDSDAS